MEGIVDITLWKNGRVVETRHGHNVWVGYGRDYLSKLISLSSFVPEVPYDDRRIRYMGFGIGNILQQEMTLVTNPPFSTAYPGGNTYNKYYPLEPLIEKLERPVRITGGSTPYPGAPSDVWLKEPPAPDFMTIFPGGTTGEVIFRSLLDGNISGANEVVYPPFHQMPLSEVGLFLDDADVNSHDNNLVAYYSFVTIPFAEDTQLEVSWKVRFG